MTCLSFPYTTGNRTQRIITINDIIVGSSTYSAPTSSWLWWKTNNRGKGHLVPEFDMDTGIQLASIAPLKGFMFLIPSAHRHNFEVRSDVVEYRGKVMVTDGRMQIWYCSCPVMETMSFVLVWVVILSELAGSEYSDEIIVITRPTALPKYSTNRGRCTCKYPWKTL